MDATADVANRAASTVTDLASTAAGHAVAATSDERRRTR